ncbi:MAG: protease, partial [Paraburkholderia sp.]|nr:protease [Paraburkholderia sp.]
EVDSTFDKTTSADYDAVVLPGGVVNGDAIRLLPQAQAFVKSANDAKKPIAVICHGGWLPVSAGIIKGRTLTSWPSLQDDIRNAGGTWVDREVVEDGNLISSRKPDDLPAFNKTLIAQLSKRKAA